MSEVFQAPSTEVNLDFGGTLKFKGDIVAMCSINPNQLDKEEAQHPGTFAWLGVMAAEAKYKEDYYDRLSDTTYADQSISFREDYAKANLKLTEENLKCLLLQHPKVIAARDKAAQAKRDSDIVRNLFEAFKCRKDLIVAMGYDQFSEQRNADVPTSRAR